MVVETELSSVEYENLALLGPMKVAGVVHTQSRPVLRSRRPFVGVVIANLAIDDRTATEMLPRTASGSAN